MVVPETLKAGWDTTLAAQGPITSIGAPVDEPAGAGVVVVVRIPVSCERGGFTLVATVSEDSGLQPARRARHHGVPHGAGPHPGGCPARRLRITRPRRNTRPQ